MRNWMSRRHLMQMMVGLVGMAAGSEQARAGRPHLREATTGGTYGAIVRVAPPVNTGATATATSVGARMSIVSGATWAAVRELDA